MAEPGSDKADVAPPAPGSIKAEILPYAQDASVFGGLWVDDRDAMQRMAADIREATYDLEAHMREYLDRGYTIFKNVISHDLADKVLRDTHDVFAHGERYIAKRGGKYIDPLAISRDKPEDRVVRISDIYAISENARDAIYPGPVAEFIARIFGEPAIAMQSISFEYGSQQAIHQDTAYVVSNKPRSLAATWLALEDVEEGAGELIYYPESHRFDHFLFSGSAKEWAVGRDGDDQHKEFLQQLHAQARARGLAVEHFLPRKGDLLVWHADLAHGGARITKPGKTRRSLVTHFCPASVKPRYRASMGEKYCEFQYGPKSLFTSKHYDLRALERGRLPPIIYDGGVSAGRKT